MTPRKDPDFCSTEAFTEHVERASTVPPIQDDVVRGTDSAWYQKKPARHAARLGLKTTGEAEVYYIDSPLLASAAAQRTLGL